MKLIFKVILEIVLGFISFICMFVPLCLFGYFATIIFDNVPVNELLAQTLLVIIFITVCWMFGSDILRFIKSKF